MCGCARVASDSLSDEDLDPDSESHSDSVRACAYVSLCMSVWCCCCLAILFLRLEGMFVFAMDPCLLDYDCSPPSQRVA